ncbi:MAG: hypothetical protein AB9866_02890 [Syntrophobacteraceae bacterium]
MKEDGATMVLWLSVTSAAKSDGEIENYTGHANEGCPFGSTIPGEYVTDPQGFICPSGAPVGSPYWVDDPAAAGIGSLFFKYNQGREVMQHSTSY